MMLQGGPDHKLRVDRLPRNLQLYSLQLSSMCLSAAALQDTFRITALKKLRLSDCKLPHTDLKVLAAALPQLPAELEHLSISKVVIAGRDGEGVKIPPAVLARLQQLTYLELAHAWASGDAEAGPAVQPLQALTRLVDLRLVAVEAEDDRIPASVLSGTQGLTCLQLNLRHCGSSVIEADVLDGKTLLQHLDLNRCWPASSLDSIPDEDEQWPSDGHEPLLSHLQHMQQLTYLGLENSLALDIPPWANSEASGEEEEGKEVQLGPPAAAYAAWQPAASCSTSTSATAACHLARGSMSSLQAGYRTCRSLTYHTSSTQHVNSVIPILK